MRRTAARTGVSVQYVIPAALFVLAAEIFPVVYTGYLGFMEWDLITPQKFVAFGNYLKVFTTPELLNALKNTGFWVAGMLILAVALPLVTAMLINRTRGKSIFKAIFFIPSTLSPTVAAIFWKRTLASQQGALGPILHLFGVASPAILTDPHINTFVMIAIGAWQYFGLNLLLFLVGLETIPPEPREAAMIDGANSSQTFFHIIVPLLRPITLLVVANALINTIRTFDIPWVVVQGGPGRISETLAVALYRESFLLFRIGIGSAIAVVLSIFSLAASWRYLRMIGQRAHA
jgi:ABC-type sugar transport system permease subunit